MQEEAEDLLAVTTWPPQRSEVHPQRMAQGQRENQMHYLGNKDHDDSEEEDPYAEELDYQTREHYARVALTVRLSDDEAEDLPEVQYINLMSSLRNPTMMIDIYLPGKEESLSRVQVLMDSGANVLYAHPLAPESIRTCTLDRDSSLPGR